MSSCICLAKMGSGASGLALYWNRLVWKNKVSLLFVVSPWVSSAPCTQERTPLTPDRQVRRKNGPKYVACKHHGTSYSPECVEGLFSELYRRAAIPRPPVLGPLPRPPAGL